MSTQTIKHWQIGDVEIARIVEVDAWQDDITMLQIGRASCRERVSVVV